MTNNLLAQQNKNRMPKLKSKGKRSFQHRDILIVVSLTWPTSILLKSFYESKLYYNFFNLARE